MEERTVKVAEVIIEGVDLLNKVRKCEAKDENGCNPPTGV